MGCFDRCLPMGNGKAGKASTPAQELQAVRLSTTTTTKAGRVTAPVTKSTPGPSKQMLDQVEVGRQAYLWTLENMSPKENAIPALRKLFRMVSEDTRNKNPVCLQPNSVLEAAREGYLDRQPSIDYNAMFFTSPSYDGTAQTAGSLRILHDGRLNDLGSLGPAKQDRWLKQVAPHMQKSRLVTIASEFDFVWLLIYPHLLIKMTSKQRRGDDALERTGRECLSRLGYCDEDPKTPFKIRLPVIQNKMQQGSARPFAGHAVPIFGKKRIAFLNDSKIKSAEKESRKVAITRVRSFAPTEGPLRKVESSAKL